MKTLLNYVANHGHGCFLGWWVTWWSNTQQEWMMFGQVLKKHPFGFFLATPKGIFLEKVQKKVGYRFGWLGLWDDLQNSSDGYGHGPDHCYHHMLHWYSHVYISCIYVVYIYIYIFFFFIYIYILIIFIYTHMSQAPGFPDCNVVFFSTVSFVVGTDVQLSWLGVCLGSKGGTAYLATWKP